MTEASSDPPHPAVKQLISGTKSFAIVAADNTASLSPGTKTPRRCLEIVLSALQEYPIEISLDFLRYITQPQFSHEEIDLLWNKAEIIWSSSRVLFLNLTGYSHSSMPRGNTVIVPFTAVLNEKSKNCLATGAQAFIDKS